jgi:hypothetical protein
MGSVEFVCACGGFTFLGSTDDRSYAAHFLPEQDWYPFLDAVDEAVELAGPSPRERADACMALRARPVRTAWQCPACGALYLEDHAGVAHRFLPASAEVPRHLFQAQVAEPVTVGLARARMAEFKRMGEAAYDRMYDATSASEATDCYSDAKEAFYGAIQLARELGLAAEVLALETRLDHIKAVFRSQFS